MKNVMLLPLLLLAMPLCAQRVNYGSNAEAGKYVTSKGARIYYEVYGKGPALLLLHGDVFGYIDEFTDYLPLLSQHFTVIAVALRGHGKSELGEQPFSYALFAEDALAALKNESFDSASVVGFSAGAVVAYHLAASYPHKIKKVVAMGGGLGVNDFKPGMAAELQRMHIDTLSRQYPGFIQSRKNLMLQPERYQELIERLKKTWLLKNYVAQDKISAIRCPVLVIGGDNDYYLDLQSFVNVHKRIPGSQLAIVPGCDHVGLIQRPGFFKETAIPFLLKK